MSDGEDDVFLGVCSHLSELTDIDTNLFRLIFILLFVLGGVSLAGYFILYFMIEMDIV